MKRKSTAARYKAAGVDIDAGTALVEAIRPLARATARPGVVGDIGGFGALFDLNALAYRDPLLVAATDGVGTKLKLAIETGRHRGVGIDLVAMCVNDIATHGAEPLFFLDYFASARLEPAVAREVVAGIAEGCKMAGCALIGGETAEMPGLYAAGDYDLAGFAVGAVERDTLLPQVAPAIAPGDVVLGLAADGAHANGFSLIRRIMAEAKLTVADPAPFAPGESLGEALLVPTRIYVRACLAAHRSGGVKAFAHITGGGITENLARVLSAGCSARVDAGAWPSPPLFRWLKEAAGVPSAEMFHTFNCGIGMAVVTAADAVDAVSGVLGSNDQRVYRIGEIVPRADGAPAVEIVDPEAPWRA